MSRARQLCSVTLAVVLAPTLAVFLTLAIAPALPGLFAQSAGHANPVEPPSPQWQIDAGGKMQFEIASVKRNTSGSPPSPDFPNSSGNPPHANISLDSSDNYTPTGGLFTGTNLSLGNYMVFAFKLTGNQFQLLQPQLPKWATTDRFDIEARAQGNPTKDQMRLMMESLLADRFKLTMLHKTQQIPVFAVVLLKPGRTGPQLQVHSEDPPCSAAPVAPTPAHGATDRFPIICGRVVLMPASAPNRARLGARNVTIGLVESTLGGYARYGDLQRPMLDRTGLTGTFDFSFEWVPQLGVSLAPRADASGPTFLNALQDQLGLKLEPTTGPMDVLVIDHVEEPSPN